jgi:hypothetical protein
MKEKIIRLAKKLDLDAIIDEEQSNLDDNSDFKMNSKGFVGMENKESKVLNDSKKRIPSQKQLESLRTAREKAHEVVRAKGTISRAKKEEQIKKRDELLEKAKQLKAFTTTSEKPTSEKPSSEQGKAFTPSAEKPEIEYVKSKNKKKIVYVSESESSSSEEEVVVVKKKRGASKNIRASPRSPSPPPTTEKQHRINSFLSAYYNI